MLHGQSVFLTTLVHTGKHIVCWWRQHGSCSLENYLLELTLSWFTFWLRDQILNLLDWTETSIIFHRVFNPVGLMTLGIHVTEIANNQWTLILIYVLLHAYSFILSFCQGSLGAVGISRHYKYGDLVKCCCHTIVF